MAQESKTSADEDHVIGIKIAASGFKQQNYVSSYGYKTYKTPFNLIFMVKVSINCKHLEHEGDVGNQERSPNFWFH